jgi:hypothetical protein
MQTLNAASEGDENAKNLKRVKRKYSSLGSRFTSSILERYEPTQFLVNPFLIYPFSMPLFWNCSPRKLLSFKAVHFWKSHIVMCCFSTVFVSLFFNSALLINFVISLLKFTFLWLCLPHWSRSYSVFPTLQSTSVFHKCVHFDHHILTHILCGAYRESISKSLPLWSHILKCKFNCQ